MALGDDARRLAQPDVSQPLRGDLPVTHVPGQADPAAGPLALEGVELRAASVVFDVAIEELRPLGCKTDPLGGQACGAAEHSTEDLMLLLGREFGKHRRQVAARLAPEEQP